MVKLYGKDHVFTKEEIEATHDLEIDIPGIDDELRAELEERIRDFEENHEQEVLNGGDGWVDKIKMRDYLLIGGINLFFAIWWLIEIMK